MPPKPAPKLRKNAKSAKYFNAKESKRADINRALTTRARRRIAYFKMLKQEGMTVPEKMTPEQREEIQKKKAAQSFQERMKIKRERKAKEREDRLQQNKQKAHEMREKAAQRERRSEMVKNARTKRGQPLMGPRIGSLLDKIKAEKGM